MRVIAGSAKGTRLAAAPAGIRPLSDRAREGLFSSLGRAVEDARVLDLYAGTGAVGIEALSRGAAEAAFVERDPRAIGVLRANLARTKLAEHATVVRREAAAFLQAGARVPFGLCFLDPPYDTPPERVERTLLLLAEGWLAPGWGVALTRRTGSSTHVIPVDWRVSRRLEYGDSLVILYREV